MKTLSLSRYALSISVAAILLAGCGGSQSPGTNNAWLVPVTTSSSIVNSTSNDLVNKSRLFVAETNESQIVIYPANVRNPRPIGKISSGVASPFGIAIDQYGTLYVQNANKTITEYRKGQKSASKTLAEPKSSYCESLTVGSDGTVYAGSFSGEVFEFAGGSTKPTKTLVVPGIPLSLALDSKNDLFVSWEVPIMSAGVVEFNPSRNSYKNLNLGAYGPLAVDLHDNLLVLDYKHIFVYKPGGKTPFRKIHTGPHGEEARDLAFDSAEKYLYFGSYTGKVYVYDYKTGKLAWTVSKGLTGYNPGGLATWPPAPQ